MSFRDILKDPLYALLIGSLLSGIFASFVASILFVRWQKTIRTRLTFARIVSWVRKGGEKDFYQIKIKNIGKRDIINLNFEVKLVKKIIVPEGRVTYVINLPLKLDKHIFLAIYNKEKSTGHFSITFNLTDDKFINTLVSESHKRNLFTPEQLLLLQNKQLSLPEVLQAFDKIKCYITSTDARSGTTSIHTYEYHRPDVEEGWFIPGSLDIKYPTNRGI